MNKPKGEHMKNGKHEYRIEINDPITPTEASYTYNFGSIKGISFSVAENSAVISFCMVSKKDLDYFTSSMSNPVRDALRKVHLYHAFRFNKGLRIDSYTIYIDDEKQVFDASAPGFPFMISYISTAPLGLDEVWQNDDFCKNVLSYTTAQTYENMTLSAIYSFLSSKNKTNELDRFTCLWTALNAFFGRFSSATRQGQPEPKKPPSEKEQILDLIKAMKLGNTMPSQKLVNSSKKMYINACSYVTKNMDDALYERIYQNRSTIPEKYDDRALYDDPLEEISAEFQISEYGILLFIIPYYWRCRFFHGNNSTLLFSTHNDWNRSVLSVMNLYLERFLNVNIPKMFEQDFVALMSADT